MAQLAEIHITRKMSTPLVIGLVPDHLPTPVREALEHLSAKRAELSAAERNLAGAKGAAWTEANDRLNTARAAADKALADFGTVNGASYTTITDAALAAFTQAMDTVNEHLVAALEALKDADQAALLFHSAKPGKPVLRIETKTALESTIHKQLGIVRSELRDVQSLLPDSLD